MDTMMSFTSLNLGTSSNDINMSDREEDQETRLTLLPVQEGNPEFLVTWIDLTYTVTTSKWSLSNLRREKQTKEILKQQNGFLKSGTMTALMGPSGAGKTTLLNCISSRITTGVSGQVNYVSNSKDDPLNVSFVLQQDHLFKDLTVRETILLAARFKLPDLNNDQRLKRVAKIAKDLNLDQCLDNKIANCSGGQIKRTSTAVELISSPNLLIFDEPTSGLDSTNAFTTIQVIKQILTNYDSSDLIIPAIICSIHQPSYEIFSLFDQVYLLSQNGENIYFEPPSKLESHLRSLSITVPDHCNPVDYLLSTSFDDEKNSKIDSKNDSSKSKVENVVNYQKMCLRPVQEASSSNKRGFIDSVFLLFSRNWILLKKNPTQIYLRFLVFLSVITIPSSLFNHSVGESDGCWSSIMGESENKNKSIMDYITHSSSSSSSGFDYLKEMKHVNNNFTFLLLVINIGVAMNAMITVVMIPSEALVVQKEVFNNWYSINSYIFTRITFLIPFVTCQCILTVVVSFYMTNQYFTTYTISIFMITLIGLTIISELVGTIFGCLFANNIMAATVATVIYTNIVCFYGGYFTYNDTIPLAADICMFLSQSKHVYDIFIVLVYGFDRCSKSGQVYKYEDLTDPRKITERMFSDLDISFKDSKFISPTIGLPDDFCVAQVINATKDYLGLNHDPGDDEYYDEEEEIPNSKDLSYPLSLLNLKDEDVNRALVCLFSMFIVYLVLTIFSVRRLVKSNL